MSPILAIDQLTKTYDGPHPVTALDGLDLEVREGEIFGLLGPNGAGKTTTIGVCTARVRPTGGSVHIAGRDVTEHPQGTKRAIGVMPQRNTLDRQCTTRENLDLHCRFFGMGRREAKRRTDELLTTFRLHERADLTVYALSGGMVQRLQLARAVAHGPRLVFLDEPTAGLDPQSRLALWDLVRRLRDGGTTVVLSTHHLAEAGTLCDRLAILDHGRILACAPPAEIQERWGGPPHVEIRLQGDVAATTARLRAIPGVSGVEARDDGVTVRADHIDSGLVEGVAQAAAAAGLRDLRVVEPTLESAFIALTGRELRD